MCDENTLDFVNELQAYMVRVIELEAEIERLRQPKTVTFTVVSAPYGKTMHTFNIDPTKRTFVRPEHSVLGYVFEPEGDASVG
jgi:predicted RNA-binding protein